MTIAKPVCLLVLGAGTGPANNLVRSLRAREHGWTILGAHCDRFTLTRSAAEDQSFLIPSVDHPAFVRVLRRLVAREGVDLLVPTSDAEVARLVSSRRGWRCRLFLPSANAVALCQDKYALARHLEAHGVPVPRTLALPEIHAVKSAFRELGRPARAWCRIRQGTNASGAAPVATAEQAQSWIGYWATMRGVPASAFTLSEYLPGRDFACQSLWCRGALVLVKAFERLAYVTVGSNPSGMSSAAALARTVAEPRVAEVAAAAIRAVDARASGVFGVDLKENVRGEPCVTEINAGRFLAGTNLLDLTGEHNMAAMYVRLGLGEPIALRGVYEAAEDYYMVRSVDELPRVVHAEGLFRGIQDART
jgi:predicted ATP-grasp superfamily ATP-dependent carboligase